MAIETKNVTIRVPVDVMERMNAATHNRNAFIVDAICEKLNPVRVDELTDTEKRGVLKGAKNLSSFLRDTLLQEASERKNFLKNIDNETFAKLVLSQVPKEAQDTGELEADVLSLEASLGLLPTVEDLTAELNRVKGKLYKAERERDLNLKLLEHGKGRAELGELMEVVYRGAVEYVVDMIARRNLPGFGDGGGLSDAAYAGIADEVRKRLGQTGRGDDGLVLYFGKKRYDVKKSSDEVPV